MLVHTEPAAPFRDYKKFTKHQAVLTLDGLKEALPVGTKRFSFDTETSNLDPEKAKLAGFSIALTPTQGYYIPIGHLRGANAPIECLDYVCDRIREATAVFMYNKKYDLNILELSCGYDMGNCFNIKDAQILVWLRDTDWKFNGLKWASEHFLGYRQPKLDDVLAGGFDATQCDHVEILEYASLDAVCTLALAADTVQKHPDLKQIFKIDNLSAEAVRRMEHNPIPLDQELLKREQAKSVKNIRDLRRRIFEIVGFEFNPGSGVQLADALLSCNIQLQEKTKTGKWSTAIDTLAKIDHPLCEAIIEYNQETKYLSAYLEALIRETEAGKPVRFAYHVARVPTGRMACGGDKKNSYYTLMNVQSAPKAKVVERPVVPCELSESPTGWRLASWDDDLPEEFFIVESGSDHHAFRDAFVPHPGHVWVSLDYKGEELRIAANFSGERAYIDPFLAGEDVHMNTAKMISGPNANKNDRKKAKVTNFASLYGATEYTLAAQMGLPVSEARDFLEGFKAGLPSLERWKSFLKRRAAKGNDMVTFFGRPRRMARYFKPGADNKQRAFGYRTCVNTVVQGTAGDILRIALNKIHLWALKNPQYRDKFYSLIMVHDEINYSVDVDFLPIFLKEVRSLMTMKFPEWPVPMEVDLEIGPSWGKAIPYTYKDGVYTPSGVLRTQGARPEVES